MYYETEKDLQDQLMKAAGELISRGIPYLEAVTEALRAPDWQRRDWELQKGILGKRWLADWERLLSGA